MLCARWSAGYSSLGTAWDWYSDFFHFANKKDKVHRCEVLHLVLISSSAGLSRLQSPHFYAQKFSLTWNQIVKKEGKVNKLLFVFFFLFFSFCFHAPYLISFRIIWLILWLLCGNICSRTKRHCESILKKVAYRGDVFY